MKPAPSSGTLPALVIHQMDCRDPDVIHTAEINNWRAQKVTLKAAAAR